MSDCPERFRFQVLRTNSRGEKRPVPVVAQATIDDGVSFQALTLGRLKELGGAEAEAVQATLLGSVEPRVAKRALRQRSAIADWFGKQVK